MGRGIMDDSSVLSLDNLLIIPIAHNGYDLDNPAS